MERSIEERLFDRAFRGSSWGRKQFNNDAEKYFGKEARTIAIQMWKDKLLRINMYGYVNPTKKGYTRYYQLRGEPDSITSQ